MKKAETNRFNKLYQRHLRLLKLQGKSQKTIDAYARAVRRIREHFDCCPDKLTLKQRKNFFPTWFNPIPGVPSKLTAMVCSFSRNMYLNVTGSG